MTLSLVWDSDAGVVDACGWQVPDLWRDDLSGKIALRFRCAGCGATGGWAVGPAAEVEALSAAARLLGPHTA